MKTITDFLALMIIGLIFALLVIDKTKPLVDEENLGKYILLNKDTLIITDYCRIKKCFYLSNSAQIDSDLVDSLIIK
jgi:hypothetical protein